MLSTLIKIAAWALLLFIVQATLSPITHRPTTVAPVDWERLAAYFALGFLFALAYPRRGWIVAVFVVGVAGALEWGQTFVPTRHGEASEFVVKAAGALMGFLSAPVASRLMVWGLAAWKRGER
jgi:VanZ family protein